MGSEKIFRYLLKMVFINNEGFLTPCINLIETHERRVLSCLLEMERDLPGSGL